MKPDTASDEMAFEVLNSTGQFPLLLTCEHASHAVPAEYEELGIADDDLRRHIGWDIGARGVVETFAHALDAPAVCSGYSRLLIDCNRRLSDADLIVCESDGTRIPANLQVSQEERQRRIDRFYHPYHEAIDRLLTHRKGQELTLLSVHSFTSVLRQQERPFDIGVLFDRYEELAQELGRRLQAQGYRVRDNEPYSGYDGLIFSARSHGERHGLIYLELEINNRLIATPAQAGQVGEVMSGVLRELFGKRLA